MKQKAKNLTTGSITAEQRQELEMLAAMPDGDISTADIQELSPETLKTGTGRDFYRPIKKPISLRIDADIIDWLKDTGQGYQTRTNQVLRNLMLRDKGTKYKDSKLSRATRSLTSGLDSLERSMAGESSDFAQIEMKTLAAPLPREVEGDHLSSEALEWAKTHVLKFGDTDIFPVPFEYEALAHGWLSLRPLLERLDLGSYQVRPDRRVLVVKPGGGFRAVTQLDPIDHLIYTAAVYECAKKIEEARIPAEENVACSYRIDPTPQGSFFKCGSGWDTFHNRSKQLAQTPEYSHVLVADIADFYNRLGHHRIQNALEMANVPLERSQHLESFLSKLTARQSQGIPVGPFASILLAEACLVDVDNFLMRNSFVFTRYVDDFHIYCRTRREAIDAKHRLSSYLFSVHRLSLEGHKSSIYPVSKFLKDELQSPKEQQERAKLRALNEIYEALAEENGPYWHEDPDEEIQSECDLTAERDSFIDLFKLCVEKSPLHLGLARHLLRKATKRRTNVLNDLVFHNLSSLVPAFRDVVNYLAVTISRATAKNRGTELLNFAEKSDYADLPFIQMWIIELFCRRPDLVEEPRAMSYAASVSTHLGLRPSALIAMRYGRIDWVRAKKETWRNHEAWDRRAIVQASSILPVGEKRPFLSMVAEQGDPVDRVVAQSALNERR